MLSEATAPYPFDRAAEIRVVARALPPADRTNDETISVSDALCGHP